MLSQLRWTYSLNFSLATLIVLVRLILDLKSKPKVNRSVFDLKKANSYYGTVLFNFSVTNLFFNATKANDKLFNIKGDYN